jgi:hypothetical protein
MDEPAASEPTPEPSDSEGKFLGLPYDLRRPTTKKYRSRMWSPDEPRFFPPKTFGWGYTINFYWLFHPVRYFRQRRGGPPG